jgi:hypothetical protein
MHPSIACSSPCVCVQVKAICEEMGAGFLGLGFDPKWAIKDIPVMPKDRQGSSWSPSGVRVCMVAITFYSPGG